MRSPFYLPMLWGVGGSCLLASEGFLQRLYSKALDVRRSILENT